MKVLIITYYWPPSGGSGVQRWLKFVKYLPQFGITPVVYVPENANYLTIDEKLLEEVPNIEILRKPFFNPQDLVFKKTHTSGVANINKGGLLSWIRGNFFIPDSKIFWVKTSVKFLSKYILEKKIDIIISSGPPHSVHLIAEKIKTKLGIKWIADFRDPWTDLYYVKEFNLTKFARDKNKRLEEKVLNSADIILTVSNTLKNIFKLKNKNVEVITNGFDDEVFLDNVLLDDKFSISHIGLLPKQSNPIHLWSVLKEICYENNNFKNDLKINLIGNVCAEVINSINKYDLQKQLNFKPYLSHKEVLVFQKKAQVLLLLIPKTKYSKGIITGKLFEYLTSKRPILAIADVDGDLAEIIEKTNGGYVVDFNNKLKLKSLILDLYDRYKQNKLHSMTGNINKYHRKNLTKDLSKIIKKLNNCNWE